MLFTNKWKLSSKSSEYRSWHAMKNRCYNEKDKCFHLYGKRGIEVCERWKDNFDAFIEDMGLKPTKKHSIDRIDSDKNYEPSNCKWSTMKEQQNNRRNNVLVTLDGLTKTIAQWSDENGMNQATMKGRIERGFSPEKILSKQLFNKTTHGTAAMYSNHKCKCEECRAFNAYKLKLYRDKIKTFGMSKKIDEKYHGTRTGYELYSCRCDKCKEVTSIKNKKYRDKNKKD